MGIETVRGGEPASSSCTIERTLRRGACSLSKSIILGNRAVTSSNATSRTNESGRPGDLAACLVGLGPDIVAWRVRLEPALLCGHRDWGGVTTGTGMGCRGKTAFEDVSVEAADASSGGAGAGPGAGMDTAFTRFSARLATSVSSRDTRARIESISGRASARTWSKESMRARSSFEYEGCAGCVNRARRIAAGPAPGPSNGVV